MVGNHAQSVKAQASLTARQTGRAGTKVGLSDPAVPYGRAVAQRKAFKSAANSGLSFHV